MSELVMNESIHRFANRLKRLHFASYYVGRTAFNMWQGGARSLYLTQLLATVAAIIAISR
jgi:hypothetical protein